MNFKGMYPFFVSMTSLLSSTTACVSVWGDGGYERKDGEKTKNEPQR